MRVLWALFQWPLRRRQPIVSGNALRVALFPAVLRAATIFLGAVILSWPLFVNGQPFLLSDTTSYVRGADAAVYRLTGKSTDWTDRYQAHLMAVHPGGDEAVGVHPKGSPITLAGRSIYYGGFVYVADRIAGLRLAAVLQALLAAICLYLTLARFRSRETNGEFLLVAGLLSVASPVAYFGSYLEPDIFTGIGLLAAANLIAKTPDLPPRMNTFWFAVMCLTELFHGSNILIVAILLAVMSFVHIGTKLCDAKGLTLILVSFTVGLAGQAAFYVAVERGTGEAPVRPPFLTARLIADGPGRDYLEKTCPQSGFVLCRHLNALSEYSDDFLWSDHPSNGVFSVVPNDERREIVAEQSRFVLAVLKDRPFAVLRSSTFSIGEQWRKWGLPEFNLTRDREAELLNKLPRRIADQQARTLAFNDVMPVKVVEALTFPVALLSFLGIAWALLRRKMPPGILVFITTLWVGIAADLTVCGGISTPHDRYSMRVFWLVPFAAFIVQSIMRPQSALASIARSWRLVASVQTVPRALQSLPILARRVRQRY